MKYIVYGLIDPRSGLLFYVGKSCKGLESAKRHSREWSLNDKNKSKNEFIRQMLDEGYKPLISILEICRNRKELEMRERVRIAEARKEFYVFNMRR